ncbi:MAG: TatD family hydrolase [Puniceicoccales bacterium]|jgi:TatD DNase family protein|nr:TatD family hydrolase [Puniceicoccales bacterium]
MDSHTHLDFFLEEQRKRCIAEAISATVEHFIIPGVCPEKWENIRNVAETSNEGNVFFALGIHPTELDAAMKEEEIREQLLQALHKFSGKKLVAVGEIGLDYYHLSPRGSEEKRTKQRSAFRTQMLVAKKKDLAMIVHCRDRDGELDAWKNALYDIDDIAIPRKKVLFHSFAYGKTQMAEWCSRGGYVSISGIATRPAAAHVREAIPHVPTGQILIETDSPYLLPHSLCQKDELGKLPLNEPKNVVEIARLVGELTKRSQKEILQQTLENGREFFAIGR